MARLALGWGAAVLAAVAGVSLVSDNKWVTGFLAIASAFVGATNVAFNPGKRSSRAYKLAFAFIHVAERAEGFLKATIDYVSMGEARQGLDRIQRALQNADNMAVRTHGE